MPNAIRLRVPAALLALLAPLALHSAPTGAAQPVSYPERPVRFVLGFPAGGASDILGRAVAQHMTAHLGQQFVVDNRPGATGIIASDMAARSTPDGYTMLLVSSSYTNNAILRRKLPFDAAKDLVPVAKVAMVPNIAVVPPSFPAKTVRELLDQARARPGQINYASGGPGTGTHLGTELLKLMAGVDFVHIPYKGTPPALVDLMAGRIQLMLAGAPPTLPHVRTGKLRAIAVTSARRSPSLPDVPAVAETVPGYEATTWYGVLVPAGTPQQRIERLNAALGTALKAPEVVAVLEKAGFETDHSTPAGLSDYMREETAKWSKVVKAANITPN